MTSAGEADRRRRVQALYTDIAARRHGKQCG
ncbi:hypothetical protein PARU111607_00230 [Palleronia rufa]